MITSMVAFAHKTLSILLKRLVTPHYQPMMQQKLATWFREACDSGSLVRYLEAVFRRAIAVMQRREDIVRVAHECALDLARDGVVYAELRGAPELFTEKRFIDG